MRFVHSDKPYLHLPEARDKQFRLKPFRRNIQKLYCAIQSVVKEDIDLIATQAAPKSLELAVRDTRLRPLEIGGRRRGGRGPVNGTRTVSP